jgi:hypothetical protein
MNKVTQCMDIERSPIRPNGQGNIFLLEDLRLNRLHRNLLNGLSSIFLFDIHNCTIDIDFLIRKNYSPERLETVAIDLKGGN